MLSVAQTIIIPLIYGSFLAILISPFVKYLERKKLTGEFRLPLY